MADFKYQFKAVSDRKKIGGSKILNIIDGFPSDYCEQKVLIYGKQKTLFGDPLYIPACIQRSLGTHSRRAAGR